MEKSTSRAAVDRIAALKDPVERNMQITQSYHELSLAFAQRSARSANWCTFATWASRQAGQTIRSEDFSTALEQKLALFPEVTEAVSRLIDALILAGTRVEKHVITGLVWKIVNPKAIMARAADAVARGNQKVYAEIAKEFARFIEICLPDNEFNAMHIDDFCASLRDGDPPGGQHFLQQAFRRYYQAFFESDPKAKAELLFWANLEIGFHEQTRLQPEIAEALNASVIDPLEFKKQLIQKLFPMQGWLFQLLSFLRSLIRTDNRLDAEVSKFVDALRRKIRMFLTEHMMTLGLPDVMLKLGTDLQASYPPSLQQIMNSGLIDFLNGIDPTPGSLKESGAVDWANLADRLHFIAELFRCYQESSVLVTTKPFDHR